MMRTRGARAKWVRAKVRMSPQNKTSDEVLFCGEGGIRTPDGVTPILPFQGSAFNRSATSPYLILCC